MMILHPQPVTVPDVSPPVPGRGSVARNFGWLLGEQVLKVLGGGLIGVILARHFGPSDFGRWAVAMSVAAVGKDFVSLGINRIVQSELAARHSRAGAVVCTHLVIGLVAAAVIISLSTWFAFSIDDAATRRLTLILAWLSLPSAFGAADIWFQGQGDLRKVTIVRNGVWVCFLALRLSLVATDASLTFFAVVALVEWALTFLASWVLLARRSNVIGRMRFSPSLLRKWASYGWPAAILLVVTAFTDRLQQYLVQDLVGMVPAGHFGASFRLAELWWGVAPLAAVAILPRLSKKHAGTTSDYFNDLKLYFDLSSAVTIGVALVGMLVAPWAITLIFGQRYAPASPILMLLLWTAPPIFSAYARTQHLTVKRTLLLELPNALTTAVLSISLCLVLAPRLGAVGAATAILISWWTGVFVTPWFIPSARPLARIQRDSLTSLFRLPQLWRQISHLLPASIKKSNH